MRKYTVQAVSGERVVTSGGRGVQVIHPPGTYGDDPVYVRVNKELAGAAWPARGSGIEGGFEGMVEINHPRCRDDQAHVYLRAQNSHSAFVYCRWMREDGMPEQALTVVRIAPAGR